MPSQRLYDVGGDRVRILIDAAATGGALGMIEAEIVPRAASRTPSATTAAPPRASWSP